MDIFEIVSAMHADVDRFEKVSMVRDAKHKVEIGLLKEKFELERLLRIQAEEDLKKAQESYQSLLKKVKESGLRDANNIEEFRSSNKLKRKQMDDNDCNNVVAELRNRVAELENENKKNLAAIEELRAKNTELARNNEINADAELLGNLCDSVSGNTEEGGSLSSIRRNILDTIEWCRQQQRELRQNKGGASTTEIERDNSGDNPVDGGGASTTALFPNDLHTKRSEDILALKKLAEDIVVTSARWRAEHHKRSY